MRTGRRARAAHAARATGRAACTKSGSGASISESRAMAIRSIGALSGGGAWTAGRTGGRGRGGRGWRRCAGLSFGAELERSGLGRQGSDFGMSGAFGGLGWWKGRNATGGEGGELGGESMVGGVSVAAPAVAAVALRTVHCALMVNRH